MVAKVRSRLLLSLVVAGVLMGMFILGGAGLPFAPDTGPETGAIEESYPEYVGTSITLTGEVRDADRNLIAIGDGDDALELKVEGPDSISFESGEEVTLYGELQPNRVITVEDERHLTTRSTWEVQYMYGISLLGVLLTVAVGLNYWRFDLGRLAFVPRDPPIVLLLGGDRNG